MIDGTSMTPLSYAAPTALLSYLTRCAMLAFDCKRGLTPARTRRAHLHAGGGGLQWTEPVGAGPCHRSSPALVLTLDCQASEH